MADKNDAKLAVLRKEAVMELKSMIAHFKEGKYGAAKENCESLEEKLEDLADESGQDSYGLDSLGL